MLSSVTTFTHSVSLRVDSGLGRGEVLERKREIDFAAAFGSRSLVGREKGGPTEVSRGVSCPGSGSRWASRRW